MSFYLRRQDNSIRNWVNGAVVADRDIVAMASHEFGHATGLGHPGDPDPSSVFATMNGQQMMTARHRDLRQWDLHCSQELVTKRSVGGYLREHTTAGFGAESNFTGSTQICKAGAGLTYHGSTPNWAAAYHRRASFAWDNGPNGSYVDLTPPFTSNGAGIVSSLWREDTTIDRVVYSFMEDVPTPYAGASEHVLRQVSSNDKFSSQQSLAVLRHCNAMGSFMQCDASGRTDLRSASRLSTAWLSGGINRTVLAWLNQDHSQDGTNVSANELWFTVGYVGNTLLPVPHKSGIRSSVGPSVACRANFSGDYDCVAVYVPIDDLTLHARATRFSVVQSGNSYALSFDSSGPYPITTAATAEPMALWYNSTDGEFYVAFRGKQDGQEVEVRRSADGVTWYYYSPAQGLPFGPPVTGPSAVSAWGGDNNILTYIK